MCACSRGHESSEYTAEEMPAEVDRGDLGVAVLVAPFSKKLVEFEEICIQGMMGQQTDLQCPPETVCQHWHKRELRHERLGEDSWLHPDVLQGIAQLQ